MNTLKSTSSWTFNWTYILPRCMEPWTSSSSGCLIPQTVHCVSKPGTECLQWNLKGKFNFDPKQSNTVPKLHKSQTRLYHIYWNELKTDYAIYIYRITATLVLSHKQSMSDIHTGTCNCGLCSFTWNSYFFYSLTDIVSEQFWYLISEIKFHWSRTLELQWLEMARQRVLEQ
jgi:hypothetical protein